jgi:hypothetical protein
LGVIYEVIYIAKDPAVVGAGFAAVRDFVSYVKHDPQAVIATKRVYGRRSSHAARTCGTTRMESGRPARSDRASRAITPDAERDG